MVNRLSPEQSERVLKNQRLVYHLAKKINVSPSDYEDFIQFGMIGLIKAVATFDETRKIQFATYASRCINNEINMYFRKYNKHLGNISLEETIHKDKEGAELKVQDIVFDTSASRFMNVIENTEIIENALSIILNCFSMREKIIILFFIGGITQKDIAKKVKLSQSYISRLEKKLFKNLKEKVSNQKLKNMKEVFWVEMVEGKFRITFYTTDTKKFNNALINFLIKFKNYEKIGTINIKCRKGKVTMYLPAESEALTLLAYILQEIEDYDVEVGNENM